MAPNRCILGGGSVWDVAVQPGLGSSARHSYTRATVPKNSDRQRCQHCVLFLLKRWSRARSVGRVHELQPRVYMKAAVIDRCICGQKSARGDTDSDRPNYSSVTRQNQCPFPMQSIVCACYIYRVETAPISLYSLSAVRVAG